MWSLHGAALLAISWAVCGSLAHDGRFYDELLWTKSNWNEYVLAFPYNNVLAKLGPTSTAFLDAIVDIDALRSMSESATIDFQVRMEPLDVNFEPSLPSSKEALSRLLGCDTRTALVEVLWPVVANWTLVHVAPLEDRELHRIADEACRIDVPVLVLKDESLTLVTIERDSSIDDMVDDVHGNEGDEKSRWLEDSSSYVVSLSRRSPHTDAGEMSAAVLGCKGAMDDTWRKSMLHAQRMFLEVVRDVLGWADKNHGSGGERGQTEIEINRSCCDYHPQCQFWASKGECKANPRYMVGNEETGRCRLACGVCQAPEVMNIPAHLSASSAQMIEDGYTDTLLFLLQSVEGCVTGRDQQSKELETLLRDHSSSHARSIADLMHRAVLVEEEKTVHATDESTGSNSSTSPEEPAADDTTLATSDPADTAAVVPVEPSIRISTFSDATIKLKNAVGKYEQWDTPKGTKTRATDSTSGEDGTHAIKSQLHDILHDRCVHVDFGTFWTYQLCYGISLIRYHEDEASLLTDQLGRFSETEESWIVVGKGTERAVVHDYSQEGAICAETGEKREVRVRFMCDTRLSSGAGIRVEVHAPNPCAIEMTVFLRDMCDIL